MAVIIRYFIGRLDLLTANDKPSGSESNSAKVTYLSALDRSQVKAFIHVMKAGLLIIVVLVLSGGQILAQQAGASLGRTNASASSFDAAVSPYLNGDLQAKESGVKLGKNLHAHGPLVQLFHARKAGDVPKRFWRLINPFSRAEAVSETEMIGARDLSPRAWTTTAGWQPGVSSITARLTSPEGGGGIGLISIEH